LSAILERLAVRHNYGTMAVARRRGGSRHRGGCAEPWRLRGTVAVARHRGAGRLRGTVAAGRRRRVAGYRAGVSSDGPDRLQPAQAAEESAEPARAGSTADFLSGDWNVVRLISDHRTGQVGSFRGKASFRPCAASEAGRMLAYSESGELRLGSHRGPARRSLLVRDLGDGTADVRFADGREFYRLDLRTGTCEAAHPCRADEYHVTVTRLSADSYSEKWRVAGPAKDYELTTTYTRAASFDAGTGGWQ
jgi:hypothetical protein